MKYYLIGCFLLLFANCKEEKKSTANRDYFYPIYSYIEKDFNTQLQSKSIEKTITINGKTSKLNLKDSTALKDLQLFKKININNPGMLGHYTGDTTYSLTGDFEKISYQANDPDTKVKKLLIHFNRGIPTDMIAEESDHSLINYDAQRFQYQLGVGYQIRTLQKILGKDTLHVDIQSTFK